MELSISFEVDPLIKAFTLAKKKKSYLVTAFRLLVILVTVCVTDKKCQQRKLSR